MDLDREMDRQTSWAALRKRTFIAFCIISFGLGFEYSLIFPSLLFYIRDVIKEDRAELFYGIALSAYPTASIIGGFTIARYADKTKRTRLVMHLLLLCEITGSLLYTLPYSPLCPVFGRFISGFGDVANTVMVAEVLRVYETHEVTSKISVMVVCFSLGYTLSPGANILFGYFDFHIGPVHIVYANLPGLFMSLCFSIVLIISFHMVSDVSREYDLKATNEKKMFKAYRRDEKSALLKPLDDSGAFHDDDKPFSVDSQKDVKNKNKYDSTNAFLGSSEDFNEIIPDKPKKSRALSVIISILTTFDLVLLLIFCFVCSFTLFGFDTLVPLIASNYFHFKVDKTSIIFVIDGILYGTVLLIIGKISNKIPDFYIIICAIIVLLFGLLAVLCLSLYHTNIYFNYITLGILLLGSTTWSMEEVLTRSLFGKLVPSSCQSYAEGIRRSVSSVAFIISGVTTAGLFKYLPFISATLIGSTGVLLAVFVYRKESLEKPVPLFHDEDDDEEEDLL